MHTGALGLCVTPSLPELDSRHRRRATDDTITDTGGPNQIEKRAVFSVSMVVVAIISAFTAGSAVAFGVQGQVAKQR